MTVDESGVFRGLGERDNFRLIEVGDAGGPIAGAVLAMRAERVAEKVRRHFVVLFVRRVRNQRDWRAVHLRDKTFNERTRFFGIADVQRVEALA